MAPFARLIGTAKVQHNNKPRPVLTRVTKNNLECPRNRSEQKWGYVHALRGCVFDGKKALTCDKKYDDGVSTWGLVIWTW